MSGYGIYVKEELLDSKHVKKMSRGSVDGIWMYLWFLNKVTRIDPETNLGIVLGGKPFKLDDFDLVSDIKTKRRIFNSLVDEGYLVTKRTPYGRVVWVTKAAKIFGNKAEQQVIPSLLARFTGLFRRGRNWGNPVQKAVDRGSPGPGSSPPAGGRSPTLDAVGLGSGDGRSNKDRTVRQNKDKTVGAAPALISDAARQYLERWNEQKGTNYTVPTSVEENLKFWLEKGYPLEKILEAVEATQYHHYFKTVRTPALLLHTRGHKSGQPVDRIGEVLNSSAYLKELQRRERRKQEEEYLQSGGTDQQAQANLKKLSAMRRNLTHKVSP